MSKLVEHARKELELAGFYNNDENKWMADNLIELLKTFSAQGHSGGSAPYCINMFKTLAMWETLMPLTGEEDEWVDVEDGIWQNVRAHRVFKDSEGAYDTQGKIFRHPDGSCYVSGDSRVPVTFPYQPTTEYVDVEETDVESPKI